MIRLRALTVLFPNGWVTTVQLPGVSQETPEVESAAEIVAVLEKYRNGLQRLIARAPVLTMGKGKVYANVDEQIHSMINARKYLDMDTVEPTSEWEVYYLDLITQRIVFNDKETERGTMPLKMFYANWREMFYPEDTKAIDDAEAEEWLFSDPLPEPPAEVPFDYSTLLGGGSFSTTGTAIGVTASGSTSPTTASVFEREVEDIKAKIEEIITKGKLVTIDDATSKAEEPEEDPIVAIMDGEEIVERSVYECLTEYSDAMEENLSSSQFILWNRCMEVIAHYCEDISIPDPYIKIAYSGSGDSGGTDEIYITDSGHLRTYPKIVGEFYDDLDRIAWAVIDTEESGFYNDDGGYGIITVGPKKFSWNHHNYYVETKQSVDQNITID